MSSEPITHLSFRTEQNILELKFSLRVEHRRIIWGRGSNPRLEIRIFTPASVELGEARLANSVMDASTVSGGSFGLSVGKTLLDVAAQVTRELSQKSFQHGMSATDDDGYNWYRLQINHLPRPSSDDDYVLKLSVPVHGLDSSTAGDIHVEIGDMIRGKYRVAYKKELAYKPSNFEKNLHSFPNIVDFYVERSSLLEQVKSSVLSQQVHLTALVGMAGSGKTSLLIACCHDQEIKKHFKDGIKYIELGKSPDPVSIFRGIGIWLEDDVSYYTDRELSKSRLQEFFSGKRILLALDEVWDDEIIRELRSIISSESRMIFATRYTELGVQFPLSQVIVGAVSLSEAFNLFSARIADQKDSLETYGITIRKIVERLEGHTQAIAIAAATLARRGLQYADMFLERISQEAANESIFHNLKLSETDKQFNVWLSFKISYDDLAEIETYPKLQQQFRALGVFAAQGMFTPSHLKLLWLEKSPHNVNIILERFVNNSLLYRRGNDRYSLHSLLRSFALALLEQNQEIEETLNRHLGIFMGLYGNPEKHYNESFFDRIELDFPNIRAAIDWCGETKPGYGADFIISISNYLQVR